MEEKINIMVQNMMKEDDQNKPGLGNSEDNQGYPGSAEPQRLVRENTGD